MKVARVSDQAVLRYLERVAGVDVERVRAHIADQLRHVPDGASGATLGGIEFKVRQGVVTTVVTVRMPEPRAIRFPKKDTG